MTVARKAPNKGDWIAVLLLQARCPDCGEPLVVAGETHAVEFDHDPALADRHGEKWQGVAPNDPRFVRIRHRDCHAIKSAREQTARKKVDRIASKAAEHERRINTKLVASVATSQAPRRRWPSRKIPSRPFQTGSARK